MHSNDSLIKLLIQEGYLKSPAIVSAFKKVDRADFVPPELLPEAYGNYPLSIGLGQTISQPATVAFMLELLAAQPGDKVLDIGSGSGWQTALLAEIVGPAGQVFGLEIKNQLINFANQNLSKYSYQNIELAKGNGWLGLPEKAPFAKIIVAAAALTVPQPLKEQLLVGGRLVMPIGYGTQDIVVIDKVSKSELAEKHYPGFVFVPLVQAPIINKP